MYKVVRRFKDKDGRIYEVGDVFPNVNATKPSNARIKTLSTKNNKYKEIYIKEVKETSDEQ